jgi:hypothetical protein
VRRRGPIGAGSSGLDDDGIAGDEGRVANPRGAPHRLLDQVHRKEIPNRAKSHEVAPGTEGINVGVAGGYRAPSFAPSRPG